MAEVAGNCFCDIQIVSSSLQNKRNFLSVCYVFSFSGMIKLISLLVLQNVTEHIAKCCKQSVVVYKYRRNIKIVYTFENFATNAMN